MASNDSILQIKKITKAYSDTDQKAGIFNASLSLAKGEVSCLVGPSGSGKSTLLKCIAGLETVDQGEISLNGKAIYVSQDFNLWPHKTVLENIILTPISLKKKTKEGAVKFATELLLKFGLADKADVYPDFLSGGQKQRVAIIRALAMEPEILLLDEITSALDPELVNSILNLVKVLAKNGQSMILATHHLKFATEVADRIIFLENGKIVQKSAPRDFIYAQKNSRINEFIKNLSFNKQEVNVYEGYDQFQAFQLGTLKRFNYGSPKYTVGSSGDRWFECMGPYYEEYERERIKAGISWTMLMYTESVKDRDLRHRHPELNEYRLIPKNYENPANYYVIEDVVVIQIFGKPGDEPTLIEIKNPHVAKSYKNYFDLLWEKGKPLID